MKRNRDHDVKLLAREWLKNVRHHDDYEFGTVGSEGKRPFGNSDVIGDILEIIGAEMEGDDGDGPCYSSEQNAYAFDLFTIHMPDFIRTKIKIR